MKTLLSILTLFTLAAPIGALADIVAPQPVTQAAVSASPQSPEAKPALPKSTDLKDQALQFILTKAEKYSGKVEDSLGSAVDAATREIPLATTEYLHWKAWKHGLTFALPALLFVLFSISFAVAWRGAWWDRSDPTGRGVLGIIAGVAGVISFMATMSCINQLFSLIEIIVAPRVYLIEAVSQLVKG